MPKTIAKPEDKTKRLLISNIEYECSVRDINRKRQRIRYSDAYEIYGMKRTGCCGCPISYRAVDDLELIKPYEPNVAKAAWNIFGKSYEYRQRYKQNSAPLLLSTTFIQRKCFWTFMKAAKM